MLQLRPLLGQCMIPILLSYVTLSSTSHCVEESHLEMNVDSPVFSSSISSAFGAAGQVDAVAGVPSSESSPSCILSGDAGFPSWAFHAF
jgi:hypothetical protein